MGLEKEGGSDARAGAREPPPASLRSPDPEAGADQPANLAAAEALADHLGEPHDLCLTAVAELLAAGATPDGIRREIPRLDEALGVWAAKRVLAAALNLGATAERPDHGPKTPDTHDATVRRIEAERVVAMRATEAYDRSGYLDRRAFIEDRAKDDVRKVEASRRRWDPVTRTVHTLDLEPPTTSASAYRPRCPPQTCGRPRAARPVGEGA